MYNQLLLSLGAPDCLVVHRTVSGGASDSVRCTRLGSGELATLGNSSAAYDYNSSDCPVSQRPPAQWSAAKSAGDAWPAPTVGKGHRTVRCAPDSVRCANGYEREMCPWAISKCFGDLVSNTSA
jgi:hypothetical protein